MRGNVMDLAIGIIIGAAFSGLVNSVVNDLFMPLIGALIGDMDFSNLYVPLASEVPTGLALEEARKLGVSGWARNCPDGSVEAHLEGDEEAVERMVALLHDGPPHAQVSNVEVRDAETEGPTSFQIRH